MDVFRTFSTKLVDAIINHPDIRPTMERGEHRIYSEEVIEDVRNVVYAWGGGCIVFLSKEPAIYEGHIGVLRGNRGKVALQACSRALEGIFTDHCAEKVTASIPLQLREAAYLVRTLGFAPVGRDDQSKFFELEKTKWAA